MVPSDNVQAHIVELRNVKYVRMAIGRQTLFSAQILGNEANVISIDVFRCQLG